MISERISIHKFHIATERKENELPNDQVSRVMPYPSHLDKTKSKSNRILYHIECFFKYSLKQHSNH